MEYREEAVYEIIFLGETVMKVSVDGNLHPSDVQECLAVLSSAYRQAQTQGTWCPDDHEEPWLGPGGEIDSIKIVRRSSEQ